MFTHLPFLQSCREQCSYVGSAAVRAVVVRVEVRVDVRALSKCQGEPSPILSVLIPEVWCGQWPHQTIVYLTTATLVWQC